MYPKLFTIGSFSIHSYGVLIMTGAVLGYFYMAAAAKKELGIPSEKIQRLAIFIIVAAFVGGKVLLFLENPGYYFVPPSHMLKNFRTGFVFYGSLLFSVPVTVWYFRQNHWPVWSMLDHVAITSCIIHLFGRLGCFLAGCCYGIPSDGPLAVTFTDADSKARPLATPLHPAQLYEVFLIGSILIILIILKKRRRFSGQLFLTYVILYAAGRGVTELFRGDVARGFVIENVLSHSQFISIMIIVLAITTYYYRSNQHNFIANDRNR